MDSQTREAREMTKNLPFMERAANFWYYKKWWVIAAVAAVLVILLTVYEIMTMPQYDAMIGMYVEDAVAEVTVDKIEGLIAEYSNDVNEDGSVTVLVTPTTASLQYENEDSVAAQTRVMSELNSGGCDLYIVDKAYYDFLMKDDYKDCFKYEYALSGSAEFAEATGLNGELYLLVRDLYPADEGKADKRAAFNNAVAVYQAISGIVID